MPLSDALACSDGESIWDGVGWECYDTFSSGILSTFLTGSIQVDAAYNHNYVFESTVSPYPYNRQNGSLEYTATLTPFHSLEELEPGKYRQTKCADCCTCRHAGYTLWSLADLPVSGGTLEGESTDSYGVPQPDTTTVLSVVDLQVAVVLDGAYNPNDCDPMVRIVASIRFDNGWPDPFYFLPREGFNFNAYPEPFLGLWGGESPSIRLSEVPGTTLSFSDGWTRTELPAFGTFTCDFSLTVTMPAS